MSWYTLLPVFSMRNSICEPTITTTKNALYSEITRTDSGNFIYLTYFTWACRGASAWAYDT